MMMRAHTSILQVVVAAASLAGDAGAITTTTATAVTKPMDAQKDAALQDAAASSFVMMDGFDFEVGGIGDDGDPTEEPWAMAAMKDYPEILSFELMADAFTLGALETFWDLYKLYWHESDGRLKKKVRRMMDTYRTSIASAKDSPNWFAYGMRNFRLTNFFNIYFKYTHAAQKTKDVISSERKPHKRERDICYRALMGYDTKYNPPNVVEYVQYLLHLGVHSAEAQAFLIAHEFLDMEHFAAKYHWHLQDEERDLGNKQAQALKYFFDDVQRHTDYDSTAGKFNLKAKERRRMLRTIKISHYMLGMTFWTLRHGELDEVLLKYNQLVHSLEEDDLSSRHDATGRKLWMLEFRFLSEDDFLEKSQIDNNIKNFAKGKYKVSLPKWYTPSPVNYVYDRVGYARDAIKRASPFSGKNKRK